MISLGVCPASDLATEFIYPIVATTPDSYADNRISISKLPLWYRNQFFRNFLGLHHLHCCLRRLSSKLPQFLKLWVLDGFSSPDSQSPSTFLQKHLVMSATATPHSWYQILSYLEFLCCDRTSWPKATSGGMGSFHIPLSRETRQELKEGTWRW